MAGLEFDLDIRGDELVQRRLSMLGEHALDARPAMEDIADIIIGVERTKWRLNRWKLKESTKERKDRQGLDERALVSSGLLQRTLTARDPSAKAHGLLLDIQRDSVRYGIRGGRTDIFYGRILEKGARKRKRGGTLPARAVIPNRLSPAARKEMHIAVKHHLVRIGAAPSSIFD